MHVGRNFDGNTEKQRERECERERERERGRERERQTEREREREKMIDATDRALLTNLFVDSAGPCLS